MHKRISSTLASRQVTANFMKLGNQFLDILDCIRLLKLLNVSLKWNVHSFAIACAVWWQAQDPSFGRHWKDLSSWERFRLVCSAVIVQFLQHNLKIPQTCVGGVVYPFSMESDAQQQKDVHRMIADLSKFVGYLAEHL